MKLNKRTLTVQRASSELYMEFTKRVAEYDLTLLETQDILIDLLSKYNRYALRIERHGTIDKRADEE